MNVLFLIPVTVIAVGSYLLFRLGFFIFRPRRLVSDVRGLLRKRGALRNMMLALAGTLGVGNIVGVAVGLRIGGAGSVFWLVISAIPAAVIKYAESSLATADSAHFGMMSVIEASFPRTGARMASIYAFFVLLLSFTMGAALQCASFSEVFSVIFNTPAVVFGILLAVAALPILFFGASGIKKATTVFVTTAALVYIFAALYLIFLGRHELPSAVSAIINGAFDIDAVGGGALGALTSRALREGFCRGILSNEAGLGTSALAHSGEVGYTPHEAGLVGVIEVILDTAVLCPLTALVLLTLGDRSAHGATEYIFSAVRAGGAVCEYAFAASLFCFAFSTVICWIAYGSSAYSYLYGAGRVKFRIIFAASLIVGSLVGSSFVVFTVDYIMLPLAVISMLTVMKSSDRVASLYRSRDLLHDLYV